MRPLLRQLVGTPYFKYFKAALWCDCPFWPDDGMCMLRDCSVGECESDEVPSAFREEDAASCSALPNCRDGLTASQSWHGMQRPC